MVNTDQILKSATELGKLIAQHKSTQKFNAITNKLQQNTDVQRLLTDYNRQMELIQGKEAKNDPIEVEDKHKLEKLKNEVIQNVLLQDHQKNHMDYLDLMRWVNEAIQEAIQGPKPPSRDGPQATQSPNANPEA